LGFTPDLGALATASCSPVWTALGAPLLEPALAGVDATAFRAPLAFGPPGAAAPAVAFADGLPASVALAGSAAEGVAFTGCAGFADVAAAAALAPREAAGAGLFEAAFAAGFDPDAVRFDSDFDGVGVFGVVAAVVFASLAGVVEGFAALDAATDARLPFLRRSSAGRTGLEAEGEVGLEAVAALALVGALLARDGAFGRGTLAGRGTAKTPSGGVKRGSAGVAEDVLGLAAGGLGWAPRSSRSFAIGLLARRRCYNSL
jgi:hypothetical protein